MTEVEIQLSDELHSRLVWPVVNLLGLDLEEVLRERLEQALPRLAAELAAEDTGRQVATDVLFALWDDRDPDPAWWRTPVGRLCARAVGDQSSETLTYQAAATILGVSIGTVRQLVHRGTLDRHPDGGILRSEVLARLTRLG